MCIDDPERYVKGVSLVDRRSPMAMRKGLAMLAKYFRREFGYDFAAYSETNDDRDLFGYLMCFDEFPYYYAVGCAVFSAVNDTKSPYKHILHIVWLHPFFRRQGEWAKLWPIFKEKLGPIRVEGPWSTAMCGFMAKLEGVVLSSG